MLQQLPLLNLLIWLPPLGAVCILLFTPKDRQAKSARFIALVTSLITILLCIPLWAGFDTTTSSMQFVSFHHWIPTYGINYSLGVDGISMPLVLLTCFTTLIVILASWQTVHRNVPQYLAAFLIVQGTVIGVFCACDTILFYFFWEAMLIPMYLSIGMWGGKLKSYAAIKFFIFTFLGSAIMLIALLYLGLHANSFNIADFYPLHLTMRVQCWLFIAFLLSFGIKVPLWPLHTWLPIAHTEAPAGGSVVLAALMLKLGAYGFLRFSLPILPDACQYFDWLMIVLSLIAIVYIGLIALAQTDMKKLIAYSSIAHMGFVTLGCFMIYVIIGRTANHADAYLSVEGAMMQMITHAFGSGAMFIAFGLLYEKMHTRNIKDFGGIAKTMPWFAAFFMVFAMSNVGLPGTSGFVGEFMVILSTFKASFWVTLLASSTLVIGAAYTLTMYKRVFFGQVVSERVAALTDMSAINFVMYGLLTLAIFFIGFYPQPILNIFHASVGHLLTLATATKL
ncbi:MAG: NADH-quinone oxidoreductase subunit M [Coxiellaceae bacterium]|nr:NADH-quinone oxidoreductase subunit M [Coxiellaceae bacterium]